MSSLVDRNSYPQGTSHPDTHNVNRKQTGSKDGRWKVQEIEF